MVARTVAETFFDDIVDSGKVKLEQLLSYVQVERCTMVYEILQPAYQHVENLSHLSRPVLQYSSFHFQLSRLLIIHVFTI